MLQETSARAMKKSPEAFRTISEVADWLDVPTHVLRFWESRFSQVKPVKRAGGRRYYRPTDMRLIGGIKRLLHDDGMTIRSVQKLLREEGVKHVAEFSQPLEHEATSAEEIAQFARDEAADAAATEVREAEPAQIAEDKADAAWEDQSAATDTGSDETTIPPAPSDADVVAFGSVRARNADAPSEETPDAPVPEPEQPDQPDLLYRDPAFEEAPAASAPIEDHAAPAPEKPALPITANAPETDPEDDAADHARPPSPAARILTMDPALLRKDPIKIEQVVAALRAVKDRSGR